MPSGGTSHEFGPFRLEPDERRLLRDGTPVAVAPKAFDLLVILVENPDRLLKKEELMERLWPGVFVEEVNLAQNISAIRRLLGGEGRNAYIQTVAGAGYRFAAPVRSSDPQAAETPAATRPPNRQRLLVLPFRMLKPDPDLDFLAFSLPDALTVQLSGLDSLIVRSSLVAARFAGDAPDLQRIASVAQVDLVVSGTLLRAGDQLRVSAQLADASAGTLIWSHTVQAPVDDLFRLQDSLVERIAGSLSTPLTPPERQRLRQDVPATAKAYEYFLRANQAGPASAVTLERATVARDLYLQALREDPAYAPAWTRLARIYRLLGKYRTEDAAANLARADEALQRALTLNPDLSMAHNLSAQIDVDRGQAERAMVRLLERLRLRGPHAEIYAGLVQACRFCGLLEASAAAHERAQQLDPALGTSVMHTYFLMARYEDVIAVSGDVKGYIFALSLAALGRRDEVLALTSDDRLASPLRDMLIAVRSLVEGRRADSVRALADATKAMADPEAFYYAARHFAHLDQPVLALEMLTKSVGGGYFCYAPLADDPWFDPVRTEPEFQRLLDQAREGHESAVAASRRAGAGSLLTATARG
jgi:DNA-binding winged helix-turn-helix (wHTH) protein/tetratricopeptide (TPR) repeat protein